MDYHYAFRQAQKDRLEDAGVIQYRPNDGFRVFGRQRSRRQALIRPIRLAYAAIINFLMR